MSELISRSAAMNSLSKVFGIPLDYDGNCDEMCDEVFAAIDALPSIDAVPVVRCKDCIYRDRAMRCIALYYGFNPHDEWFCANGTRMDDEKSEEDTNGNQTD